MVIIVMFMHAWHWNRFRDVDDVIVVVVVEKLLLVLLCGMVVLTWFGI